jgi:hypothetical protein
MSKGRREGERSENDTTREDRARRPVTPDLPPAVEAPDMRPSREAGEARRAGRDETADERERRRLAREGEQPEGQTDAIGEPPD